MSLKVNIKKVHPDATIPSYAHDGDAAVDLYCAETITIQPDQRVAVATGVALELPEDYVAYIWDKSGLSNKHGLKTMGGIIDAGYRGEYKVLMINLGNEPYTIEKGHKVAQMFIEKRNKLEFVEVDELSDTARGAGGFGSTGK
jgi:dUTP pyrophosphatase